MTEFDRALKGTETQFGFGGKFPDVLAFGRWINPALGVLGALILSGYVLAADPATPVASKPSTLGAQTVPPMRVSAQPAVRSETSVIPYSSPAQESARTSTIDVLEATLSALLAFAGLMVSAWLGLRRARALTQVDEPRHDEGVATDSMMGKVCALPRSPTCERMYDETRLVPQYLRRAAFPATKSDLLRLAEVYADEGRALRRLGQVPDRCYGSLHELITEIHVD